MSGLVLRKSEFFISPQQSVAVAGRYPQPAFAEHSHDFCELILVWRGNGLHKLNGRAYRITRGDLFYIRAEDVHSYASVNDLVLQNIIWCPKRFQLAFDWPAVIPAEAPGAAMSRAWRLSSQGMTQARSIINQLEHENHCPDAFSHTLSETLFLQLLIALRRYRYRPDRARDKEESVLDLLIAHLSASLDCAFDLDAFCAENRCSERVLRQQFRQQTGMSINHYLRQLRICHAQHLLQQSALRVSEVAMRCGFEDSNYFSVVFARETGLTPRQWRQHHAGAGAS
ncbi:HTH-type transcriptional activator RhaR [Erwinia sp. HR93]|uniref:HTH-type transcriptional activator RhaR n=1 Tax=Erwinia sp. HR93 TaxID=3094840 RepID=UPI002ADEFB72|nr:HTH-type transcriptional activator RhaR [Erwinia sp. HR93]MEA1062960.1 HTH-type transcriptional activator RhaR [Erwinia sp. HR93]